MSALVLPDHLSCLHDALLLVDMAPVECDGHTLMVSVALSRANVPHERVIGTVTGQGGEFSLAPHFWIRIDGFILDYRLRMWVHTLSGPEKAGGAPFGIFSGHSYPHGYQYNMAEACPIKGMNPAILNLITDGFSEKLVIPAETSNYYTDKAQCIISND